MEPQTTAKKSYSKKRKSIVIDIDGEDYLLKEMDGDGLNIWMQLNAERMIVKDGEMAGMRPVKNLQAKMIALNLYDMQGKPVPESVIASWGAECQNQLYADCEALNGMSKEAKKEQKKD